MSGCFFKCFAEETRVKRFNAERKTGRTASVFSLESPSFVLKKQTRERKRGLPMRALISKDGGFKIAASGGLGRRLHS